MGRRLVVLRSVVFSGLCSRLRPSEEALKRPGVLSSGNKLMTMSTAKKYSLNLSLDQVVEVVEQLSDKDMLKLAKRLRQKTRSEALDRLIAVFSKVKMSEKEITALVEEVRKERYASPKARMAER